ncbi:hypothetical protein JCM5296_001691 [Sporobolomyces johnsonii]
MRYVAPFCCAVAAAAAASSIPHPFALQPSTQLAFLASPDSDPPAVQSLFKLTWNDRSALEQALDRIDGDADGADVWFAGRQTVARNQHQWALVLRTADQPKDRLLQLLSPGVAAPSEQPTVEVLLSSIASHLSSPSLSPSSLLALSSASISNLSLSSTPPVLSDPIHDTFHSYDNIHTLLLEFEKAFPEWVSVFSLGQSSEGRDIWAVHVTNQTTPASEPDPEEDGDDDGEASTSKRHRRKKHHRRKGPQGKLGFTVAGAQHAREWIAPSTILYLVHYLVVVDPSTGLNPHAKLLNKVDFTFVPVVNPDGYVHTWTVDRLWRKSRQPSSVPDCFGIDLNRNWGYKYSSGARPNPCSDSYAGRAAFESVELKALSEYLLDEANGIDAFLDLHSFGQMLLFPYSYSCDAVTRDEENLYEAVLSAAKALRSVHGRQFETGSVCQVSLTSPGESLDWTYAVAKIRWSFAAELRDNGVFGFLLPPSQIRPSGEEFAAALDALTQFVLDKEAGKR